jgi:hypothetical protein
MNTRMHTYVYIHIHTNMYDHECMTMNAGMNYERVSYECVSCEPTDVSVHTCTITITLSLPPAFVHTRITIIPFPFPVSYIPSRPGQFHFTGFAYSLCDKSVLLGVLTHQHMMISTIAHRYRPHHHRYLTQPISLLLPSVNCRPFPSLRVLINPNNPNNPP